MEQVVTYEEYLNAIGVNPSQLSPDQHNRAQAAYNSALQQYSQTYGSEAQKRQQQQKPGAGEQIAGAAGQIGGTALGSYAASQLLGSGAPSTPVVVSGTSSGTAGTAVGSASGAAPSAPTVVGAQMGATGGSSAGAGSGVLTGALGVGLAGGAVGAAYGPSFAEHFGELLTEQENVDSDSAIKSALLAGGPLTAWIPPVLDWAGIELDWFDSGKSKGQKVRDVTRKHVDKYSDIYADREAGDIKLADGRTWNTGSHPTDSSHNIDWKQVQREPDRNELIGRLNPLVSALIGNENQDVKAQMVGELYNAATLGGGDPYANIQSFYDNTPIGWGDQKESVRLAWENEQITADQRDAEFAAIDKQFGVANPNGTRWEDVAGLSEEQRARNDSELSGKKRKK